MSNEEYQYKENSLDSKLTRLLVQNEQDSIERHQFRVAILSRLDTIEKNTNNLDLRILKLEEFQRDQNRLNGEQAEINSDVVPVLSNVKVSFFNAKNLFLFISLLLSAVATFLGFFKQ